MAKHICGCKCEVFSRVVGYIRPFKKVTGSGEQVNGFNPGKMAEMKDRKLYSVQNAMDKIENKTEKELEAK